MRRRGALAALGALCLLGALPFAAPVEAAWTQAQASTATATTVSAPTTPTSATCVPTSVIIVGLQNFKLTWSSTLPLAFQRVDITKNGTTARDTGQIQLASQTGGVYTYTATYDTAKLLSLLNLTDLLGGTYAISIQTGYPGSSWYATPRSFTLNVILLGLGSTCT
ncbi:hypothetical protein ACFVAE_00715 [Microbacterium sp. NPDC057659]|uniref:hypothetical protein n=1 Tax=Microbacterium sp. NPDC057659 TaxID=3346198 RepID=UPI00366EEA94